MDLDSGVTMSSSTQNPFRCGKCLDPQNSDRDIEVDAYQAFHDEVSENVIHHGLEGCRAIGETEEHHQGLEQSSVGSEGSLPLITLLDPDIIVPPPNIQLGEVLCP